ncbi:DUF1579 domain-containing protein [Aequorivita echinoideorum]|uniref:DUF1579 family protein n=1 Tax=Aequorivita echinoideorum TaxID=1549647 RepID=A0ABS5S618_9FLAO|nr:DUF1579 domain-containing protein [Aequorivita echinoideorum]MBT0608657.1 DUF1579 family protein [Aequorivita echinoideorum]
MKKFFITCTAIALCFVSCNNENKKATENESDVVVADTTATEAPEMAEEPMDSIAMQKAWENYMTPGEPHQWLAKEEGTWNAEMTFWMGPDAPPEKANSTANIKMILGGRYQEAVYTGEMMGMPFEGRSTIGYDNAAKKWTSTWIDNMGTGIMIMNGTSEDGGKTSNFEGTFVDPMTGKEKKMRETYTVVDENTRKMEMFNQAPNGSEYKSMEILLTRK